MDSEFKYNTQIVQINSIEVEDIGNCALEAIDQLGRYYYYIIVTNEGWSKVITFGPVVPDIILLPTGYKSSYDYMSYADGKMEKMIKKWVLGGKGVNFESVRQITVEEAVGQHRRAIDPLYTGG